MEIEEQRHGAVTILRPQGPLALDDATRFARRAQEAAQKNMGRIVVDASMIPYVDSSGLEALVDISDMLGECGQSLKMCCSNETLREVFDLADVASLIERYADVNAAVRSFL